MKHIFIALTLIFASCMKTPIKSTQEPFFTLEHRGAMRDMFLEGNIKGNISLTEFSNKPHLYAVAPLEGLSGEIMILDSIPYISFIRNNSVVVEKSFDKKAIFMVWAEVSNWQEITIPTNVKSYSELEQFVAQSAKSANIDINKPFPFLLKGNPLKVNWHINNYISDNTPVSREKHDQSKFKGVLEQQKVEILGFYSDKHQGIFTHHSSNTHMHMRNQVGDIIGHTDDITLGDQMLLYLPK